MSFYTTSEKRIFLQILVEQNVWFEYLFEKCSFQPPTWILVEFMECSVLVLRCKTSARVLWAEDRNSHHFPHSKCEITTETWQIRLTFAFHFAIILSKRLLMIMHKLQNCVQAVSQRESRALDCLMSRSVFLEPI